MTTPAHTDQTVSVADRAQLGRRAQQLAAASVAYNAVEAVIAIAAGVVAGSVALVGFGLDSVVEVSSGLIILWQFRHRLPESREKQALRLMAISFFALAAYIAFESGRALLTGAEPDPSPVGIWLAVASLLVMPFLSWAQRRTGRALGSNAVVADSTQTLLCTYLSAVLLVGLVLNATLGWSWADPVAGLVIAAVAAREGLDAWRGENCGCGPAPAATGVLWELRGPRQLHRWQLRTGRSGRPSVHHRREPGNSMTVAALTLFAVYLVVGFGVRTVVQVRRTGDSGWRGISGRPGTREWWAGAAFAAALVAGVLGPVTATFGLDPIDSLTTPLVQIVASGTAAVGITGTFLTQVAMGSSWRIGVDETETETTRSAAGSAAATGPSGGGTVPATNARCLLRRIPSRSRAVPSLAGTATAVLEDRSLRSPSLRPPLTDCR